MVTLETCLPFRNLNPTERQALRRIARESRVAAGQEVFKEGDPGDGVYVVADGLVEISARISPEAERVFTQVGPGGLFGEMAVLELKPRSATAKAAQNSVVYFIPRDELLAMVQRSPVLALELLREISQRLREFNQRYLQETLQSERLAVLGRFTRSIVHDLKNPLNIIGLSAEIAGMEKATLEKRREAGATIREQIERVSDLTSEILLFTQDKRPEYVLGVSDYTAFVQQVLDSFRSELERRRVQLVSGVPPAPVILAFDRKRLRRVFDNLIHNATDAMPEGGKLFVRFRVVKDELVTEIEDTGPGVPPEIAGKLFQAFTSYGKAEGTGLGLSICKRIIEDHHGRIWAEHKAGQGAVFSFALPLPT
jgi:signal transduction histidine kinase